LVWMSFETQIHFTRKIFKFLDATCFLLPSFFATQFFLLFVIFCRKANLIAIHVHFWRSILVTLVCSFSWKTNSFFVFVLLCSDSRFNFTESSFPLFFHFVSRFKCLVLLFEAQILSLLCYFILQSFLNRFPSIHGLKSQRCLDWSDNQGTDSGVIFDSKYLF
jgi:hypothetical protein